MRPDPCSRATPRRFTGSPGAALSAGLVLGGACAGNLQADEAVTVDREAGEDLQLPAGAIGDASPGHPQLRHPREPGQLVAGTVAGEGGTDGRFEEDVFFSLLDSLQFGVAELGGEQIGRIEVGSLPVVDQYVQRDSKGRANADVGHGPGRAGGVNQAPDPPRARRAPLARGGPPVLSGVGARLPGVDRRESQLRPVWLLDTDGVLNVDHPIWAGGSRSAMVAAGERQFRLTWAPALLDRVRALDASGAVEIRWATTWARWRQLLEDLWDLPAWPVATDVDEHFSHGTVDRAKLGAALAVVDQGRPLVWVDDLAIPRFGPARLVLEQAGSLLIAPDPRHGLTPSQMDRIERTSSPCRSGRQGTIALS